MIVKIRKRGNKWGSWMHVPTSQEESEGVLITLSEEKQDGAGKTTQKTKENLPSFTRPDYKKAFEEKQEKETTGLKIGAPRITSSQDSLPLENFGRKIITETPISKALGTLATDLSQTINNAAHELANWLTGETLNPNLFLPIQAGKRRMNWESFSTAAEFLLPKINKKQFTCIYGQPRGGLILAVILSHKLGLPLSLTPYPSMLWCDDIVDSGNTYLKMKQKFPKAIYCSLLAKKFQNEVLHAFDYSDKNEWIIFPWETKESTEGQ